MIKGKLEKFAVLILGQRNSYFTISREVWNLYREVIPLTHSGFNSRCFIHHVSNLLPVEHLDTKDCQRPFWNRDQSIIKMFELN